MITDKHFTDWEANTFGFGYGTGEQYTIKAIKEFFALLKDGRSYDFEVLEKHYGELAAWLLINLFCKAQVLSYGTSPRYGFLDEKGELLRDFIATKTEDELYNMTAGRDSEYVHCMPHYCNCDGEKCKNPLF